MIATTAIRSGTRVRFTKAWKIYLITTVPAGTTGTVTSDDCANEEPFFRVRLDDQYVRDDLEDFGGELHMLRGWEDYLELDSLPRHRRVESAVGATCAACRCGIHGIRTDSERKRSDNPPAMPAKKILVVDDDDALRESLVEQLSLYEEFETDQAATGAEAVQQARLGRVDLVVMDVGLPDMDGREAVKLLRKGGFKAPVIMLTGQDSESDTILGLEAGANDYVTKPLRFAVLLARIRAQLRQHEQSEDAVFSIGHYTFRPSAKMLVDERGQKIRLTEKETSILKFLYRAGEKVIARDVLLHEVWGYNSGVTTHTLETHIYRLRQRIERDPSNAELLVTDVGGYKLVP